MDLYDIAIARKLSSGGGGGDITVEPLSVTENNTYTAPTGKAYSPVTVNVSGGSSDFTTATVTVTNNTAEGGNVYVPIATQVNGIDILMPWQYVASGASAVLSVALYKGTAFMTSGINATDASITGSIINVGEGLLVQGDGTITIS